MNGWLQRALGWSPNSLRKSTRLLIIWLLLFRGQRLCPVYPCILKTAPTMYGALRTVCWMNNSLPHSNANSVLFLEYMRFLPRSHSTSSSYWLKRASSPPPPPQPYLFCPALYVAVFLHGRQNNAPTKGRNVCSPIPGRCKYVILHGKRIVQMGFSKDCEIGRLAWITHGSPS